MNRIRSVSAIALTAIVVAVPGARAQTAGVAVVARECAIVGAFFDDGRGGAAFACTVSGPAAFVSVGTPSVTLSYVVGCISILDGQAGADHGCDAALDASAYAIDAGMTEGQLTFTVPSSIHEGGTLSVDASLAGSGDPHLAIDSVPLPPPGPSLWAQLGVFRDSTVAADASLVSSTVGGGSLSVIGAGTLLRDFGPGIEVTLE